jgi:hypothetical protein
MCVKNGPSRCDSVVCRLFYNDVRINCVTSNDEGFIGDKLERIRKEAVLA